MPLAPISVPRRFEHGLGAVALGETDHGHRVGVGERLLHVGDGARVVLLVVEELQRQRAAQDAARGVDALGLGLRQLLDGGDDAGIVALVFARADEDRDRQRRLGGGSRIGLGECGRCAPEQGSARACKQQGPAHDPGMSNPHVPPPLCLPRSARAGTTGDAFLNLSATWSDCFSEARAPAPDPRGSPRYANEHLSYWTAGWQVRATAKAHNRVWLVQKADSSFGCHRGRAMTERSRRNPTQPLCSS